MAHLPGLPALDLPAAGSLRRWVTRLLRGRPFLQLGSSRVIKLARWTLYERKRCCQTLHFSEQPV